MQRGKSCVVVGGTHGIGLAIAKKLLSEEAALVIVCSRKDASVQAVLREDTSGGTRLKGKTCNVSDAKSLNEFVSFVKTTLDGRTLDVLVSNVGVDPVSGKILDAKDDLFDKIFNTNVRAAWLLVRHFRPLMARGSAILLVSSTGGFQPSYPSGLYGTSKTALIGLGRALAGELGPDGIRINTVCPGLVKTRMSEQFWKGPYGPVAEQALFLRRLGEPEDIASMACFLCSEGAGWMTGEAVVVSGGTHGRL